LSVAQDFAVELLVYLDGLKEGRIEADTVKAALVASGKFKAQHLFPDWFPDEQETEQGGGSDDTVYDYQEVVWESPSTSGIDEFERLQEMLKSQGVSLADDEGPVQEAPAFFASDDESAEWV
jgi:hypothetical protein